MHREVLLEFDARPWTSAGLANLFPFAGGPVFRPVLGPILEAHGASEGPFPVEGHAQALGVLMVCAAMALVASMCLRETLVRPD